MIEKNLHTGNTVFYSTANAGYAIYAATSLLTVRDHISGASLYLLSSGLSDKEKRILDENDIKYMELDLSNLFTKTWDYPIECYYIFAGPEIFSKEGYEYSVYIDGDVLCMNNPLSFKYSVKAIAGVASAGEHGNYAEIFGDDWGKIKKMWKLSEEISKRKRVNAGVVYFNNNKMSEMSLLKTAQSIFSKSLKNGVPRKGDDSLFSLIQYLKIPLKEVLFLDPKYNFIIQFNNNEHPPDDVVFFHFSIDKPWKVNPFKHTDKRQDIYNHLVRAWRGTYKKVDPIGFMVSSSVYAQITLTLKRLKNLIKDSCLWIVGLKKGYFTRRGNTRKDPIKLYWWSDHDNGITNFGDEMTRDVLLNIYGYRSIQASPETAELAGAGSIVEILSNRHNKENCIYVWGSGFMWEDNKHIGSIKNLKFAGVRGVKSLAKLNKHDQKNVFLGDPGLLASLVYQKSKKKDAKIGVVVHFADAEDPIVRKLKKDSRFKIINPLQNPALVAKDITSCRLVLSSSLHGLIFADSFGVPNIHVKFSNKVAGGSFKFEDYYSATTRKYKQASLDKIFNDDYLIEITSSYQKVAKLRSIQRKIIKALPRLR